MLLDGRGGLGRTESGNCLQSIDLALQQKGSPV